MHALLKLLAAVTASLALYFVGFGFDSQALNRRSNQNGN